jgi:hypothetical protein
VQVRDTVQPNAGAMIQAVSDVNRDWIAEQAESDVRTLRLIAMPSPLIGRGPQSGTVMGTDVGSRLAALPCSSPFGGLQLAKGISQYQPGKMVVNDTLLKLARTSP